MGRRSRHITEKGKRRYVRVLFVFCVITGIITTVAIRYRQKIENLADVWQEIFPVVEERGACSLRGIIYDRNFKELAQTLERVSLYVRPREIENVSQTAARLSKILGLPETEIVTALRQVLHLVWLRRDIDQEDEEKIAALNLPGVYLHRELARSYPEQEKAAHLIGYSENDQGLSGVEHYYNRLLNTERILKEDLPEINLEGLTQTSGNGHNLVLTLDMKIQTILEEYTAGLADAMGRGRIASLLLDCRTGKIIAGVNFPSYNPNNVWQHENGSLKSLFFMRMLLPETFRQFFFTASLLQRGWETGPRIYPWSIVSGKSDISGQLRLWDRLQLTTDIHVDFSAETEQSGNEQQYVGSKVLADLGAVPVMAIPLKVLLGMSHLLNGGIKIQPHILDRIIERPGQKEYSYDAFHGAKSGHRVFPPLVSAEMRKVFATGGRPGIIGSAQLFGESVSLIPDYSGGRYVRDRMSLVAMPADNPEMILFIVSRENEIGPLAAGVIEADFLSSRIDSMLPSMVALQQVYKHSADMMKVEDNKEENFKRAGQPLPGKLKNVKTAFADHIQVMPDVVGLSLRKGLRLLQRAKVDVVIYGSGRIINQAPEPGKKLLQGGQISLTLKTDNAASDN